MREISLSNTIVGLLLVLMGVCLHILSSPNSQTAHDLSIFLVSGGIGLLGTDKAGIQK
jgi:hypothetical protein